MSDKVTDVDIAEARQLIKVAFELCGLTSGNKYVCPHCETTHRSALNLRVRNGHGTWKCFKTDTGGDTIGLVMERFSYSFPNAVRFILGRPVTTDDGQVHQPKKVKRTAPVEDNPSVVDNEVYGFILNFSGDAGRRAAAEYYGFWHISPEAVYESGASKILDMEGLHRELISRFGVERLKGCGVMTVTQKGADMFLFNKGYPVIEPHITPSGFVAGLQFRPDGLQRQKVEAHIAYAKLSDEQKKGQPQVPYAPKFLSLKGVHGSESLVGLGLPRLATLAPGTRVRVVEGFKDYLAARTMGYESYGIAGTSAAIDSRILELIRSRGLHLDVCLDGDEAGVEAQARLVEFFTQNGISASPMGMPPGQDVADILVGKFASAGCRDTVCLNWLQKSGS